MKSTHDRCRSDLSNPVPSERGDDESHQYDTEIKGFHLQKVVMMNHTSTVGDVLRSYKAIKLVPAERGDDESHQYDVGMVKYLQNVAMMNHTSMNVGTACFVSSEFANKNLQNVAMMNHTSMIGDLSNKTSTCGTWR